MDHRISDEDRAFRRDFEAFRVSPHDFGHRAHVRLAYVYLVEHGAEEALGQMRSALHAFLDHHGVDRTKYHETMTRAWLMAVRHFMASSEPTRSADAFIDANPRILDAQIMSTHYSTELLLSDQARSEFVAPDREPIPRHA